MAEDFSLVAKIKADTSDLMKQINDLPSQVSKGLKLKLDTGAGTGVGKQMVAGNSKMLGFLSKSTVALGAISLGVGLLVKSSGKLQVAIGRLTKVFLLFFKPAGDLLAKEVNKVAKVLRTSQKEAKKGAETGGEAGSLIGEDISKTLGLDGAAAQFVKDVSKEIGEVVGGFIGGVAGFFGFSFEDVITFINDIGKEIDDFFNDVGTWADDTRKKFDEFFKPLGDAASETWDSINTDFIDPIKAGLLDIKTAFDETATALKDFFVNNFIDPVVTKLKEWYTTVTDTIIKPIVEWLNTNVIDPMVTAWETFGETVKGVWSGIWSKVTEVYNSIKSKIDFIRGFVGGGVQAVNDAVLGGKQVGSSFIPSDGLYNLHRGEQVVGATQGTGGQSINFSPSITVNVTGERGSSGKEEEIYRRMMRRMEQDFRRLV